MAIFEKEKGETKPRPFSKNIIYYLPYNKMGLLRKTMLGLYKLGMRCLVAGDLVE